MTRVTVLSSSLCMNHTTGFFGSLNMRGGHYSVSSSIYYTPLQAPGVLLPLPSHTALWNERKSGIMHSRQTLREQRISSAAAFEI